MAEESKKISFGFAKSIKKPVLIKQVPQEEKKVDYIECLDSKAIKVIGGEEKKEEPLIIPLLGSKTWHDRIVNKIDADIFESKPSQNDIQDVEIKEEPKEIINGDSTSINDNDSNIQRHTESSDENKSKLLTLEEQAAKEIIEDLNATDKKDDKLSNLSLPLKDEQNLRGVEESTLEDYEKIPVDAFGLALLRGMGWKPGKGIGKNEKIVATVVTELRPKGMGLGADKITLQKQNGKPQKEEEELRMEKGSFIKIIVGKKSNTYGQIEGFDEDAGRLIVKMALGGNIISLNERIVQAVTEAEYLKNSKVLNATKYEEYKSKEGGSKKRSVSPESIVSNESDQSSRKKSRKDDNGHKSKKSSKKSKHRQKNSPDSNSDDNKKKSRKRKSSSSSDTYRSKKTKKSKKHKEKDRERERKKDKKSRCSKSPDRRKPKMRKRSRSSSRR